MHGRGPTLKVGEPNRRSPAPKTVSAPLNLIVLVLIGCALANGLSRACASTDIYICNVANCSNILAPQTEYYSSIPSALEVLNSNLSILTPPFRFWLVPGFYGDLPSFNSSMKIVEILTHLLPEDPENLALIGGATTFGQSTNFSLTLNSVRLVISQNGPCISLQSSESMDLIVTNSSVNCPVMVSSGIGSRLNLTYSHFTYPVRIGLGSHSSVLIHDCLFEQLNATTTSNTTVVLWSNWFAQEIFVWTEFNRLFAFDNGFLQGVQLMTFYSSLHLWDNWFMAQDELSRFNASLSSNLAIAIRCQVHFVIEQNQFFNGTFHISDISDSTCGLSIAEHSSLRNNSFTRPDISFSAAYDVLKKPAEFAISVSTGLHNALARTHQEFSLLIDATQNFWGDPSGPYLCCNDAGTGAYTSLFIDTSNWCLDYYCLNTSNVTLPRSCVTEGCFQELSRTEIIVFWTSFAFCLAVLLPSICFNIYHNARHFNLGSFYKYSQEHLLAKAHVQWRVGMFSSTLGSLLALANIVVLLVSTLHTKARTHQHIIPFRAFAILCSYVAIAVSQVIINSSGFIASFIKWKHFAYFAKPLYVWNIVIVALTTTVALGWIPTAGFVDLLANYFITETSNLTNLLYVNTVLICIISLGAFIPVRLMNELLFHYDAAKISSALEIALLKELMRSAAVEKRAKILRYVTVAAFVLGLCPTVTTIWDVTVDQYFRTRLITSTVQHFLGLSCLVATFAITFYYNQDVVLTAISVVMSTVTVATIQDIIFWGYYLTVAVNSVYLRWYVILQVVASILWVVALILDHLLVHYLKRIVAKELPLRSLDNLNQHIDETMTEKPIGGLNREHLPLLFTTDSESETPRSTPTSRGTLPRSDKFSW